MHISAQQRNVITQAFDKALLRADDDGFVRRFSHGTMYERTRVHQQCGIAAVDDQRSHTAKYAVNQRLHFSLALALRNFDYILLQPFASQICLTQRARIGELARAQNTLGNCIVLRHSVDIDGANGKGYAAKRAQNDVAIGGNVQNCANGFEIFFKTRFQMRVQQRFMRFKRHINASLSSAVCPKKRKKSPRRRM